MTVPSIFNTDFVRLEDLSCSDVADVVADIGTILTATLPVASRWTDLGSGEYQSPAIDPSGANHYMRILVQKTAATRMRFHVKNSAGVTVQDGEIDFTTSMQYRIWAGPYHLAVEFEYSGPTYEVAWASMIDPTPLPHVSIGQYITCCARRKNLDGSPVGTNYADEALMIDDYGFTNPVSRITTYEAGSGPVVTGLTSAGSKVALPLEMHVYLGGAYNVGKCYQMVFLPTTIAYKTTVSVPIDNGVTGDFEVCGKTVLSYRGVRLAFRRA
jgi:hypothetical protein